MTKYNFNTVNEDFDFDKAAKRIIDNDRNSVIEEMDRSIMSRLSPAAVLKDMFKVKGFFGFNEVFVDSLYKKSYENIVKDCNHNTPGRIKSLLLKNEWHAIERESLDLYFAEDNILIGQNAKITNERILLHKDGINKIYKSPKLYDSHYIIQTKMLLKKSKEQCAILDKNPELRSFIIDVIKYLHDDVATFSYRINIFISPDNGIIYCTSFLRDGSYKCAFILTGLVMYESSIVKQSDTPINKQDKRDELTLRRVCAYYKKKIHPYTMYAKRINDHMVLTTSFKYKIVDDKYKFFGNPQELWSIINARWYRTTYDDKSKVLPPDWYNPEGYILKSYRATDRLDDDTAGLIVWFDMVPDETKQAGVCNAYIGLTGDITYDSKTGKPLYNNKLNICY